MSQLFSKSALQQAISATHGHDLSEEIAIVNELYKDYLSGNTNDETRYEQRFNNLFFGQLLGYEENTHRHPKASTPVGSKIADVGLGFFEEGKYTFEGVKVVVELKGSGTLLDKKQASYGGQSPVDQGFGYKTSFKDCPRLLVSNFASIRLYRDNKQDFEIWTLEQLVDPSNEYYHLRTLLGLLRRSRLISQSGKSYTETLLSEVRIKQEKITKSFYREYKGLRFELINDIRHNNPDLDVETVVEKAQKIIDRIVFILFCEDKGLLPEHKLLERVREYQKRGRSPWLSLVDHFVDIDQGNPAIGIPQYNGGLFHRDEILKTIHVGDAICHKFIDLGKYNFDDELSVNILGHIFEQSISDIEQLKVDLLGQEVETDQLVEKKESKRKKDGIFYTPEYIVDYIVQNSLMVYLEEKEQSCLDKVGKRGGYKTELEAYQAYQQILHHVKVLDPACGSGAFLVKVFDYLYRENERVGEIVGSLFDVDEIYKSILRNNIYGVDLNPESVEITKLSLWLKSAQKGKKLNNLDNNIKCGNSLIDDPAVAGDRAFDWQKEFSDIMGAGGFDVIVGNPPYVSHERIEHKEFIKNKYISYSAFADLYILFYELSYNLIKHTGICAFITSNSFLRAEYGKKLRDLIHNNCTINQIINIENTQIFSDATVNSVILIFTKGKTKDNAIIVSKELNNNEFTSFVINNHFIYSQNDFNGINRSLQNSNLLKLKNKIKGKNKTLEEYETKIRLGLATGDNNAFVINKEIKNNLENQNTKNGDIIKPILRGRDIDRYFYKFDGLYLLLTKNGINVEKEYPDIYNYLDSFGEKFKKRGAKGNHWTNLRACSFFDDFKEEKIIWIELTDEGRFTICTDEIYLLNSAYFLIPPKKFKARYLLAILNSKVIKFYLKQIANTSGVGTLRWINNYIKEFPIPEIPLSDQQPFIEKADQMLEMNKELHDKIDFVLRFISTKFGITKLSTKLQKFYNHDFFTFLKELKSAKLSLTEQAELMDFFETKKSEILKLKNKIDMTDKEIDEMVYNLYGLNDEEKKIVEGS